MHDRRREPMRLPAIPSSSVGVPAQQLYLLLDTRVLARLDTKSRESVVAILARLLLEAARPGVASEGGDDAL